MEHLTGYRVDTLLQRAAERTALVVGDLMLDEYLFGVTERISPEAPVQVVDVRREEMRLGGAGNVVNNLRDYGVGVRVAGVIGGDDTGTRLVHAFTQKGVDVGALMEDPNRRTGIKTRVIASHQQIVRVDRESRLPLSDEVERRFIQRLSSAIDGVDVVVISDYQKGVLTPNVLRVVMEEGARRQVPVIVDPKGDDYRKYRGATILTPNRKEAEAASRVVITSDETLDAAARIIMEQAELHALLITRSEQGMSLYDRTTGITHIPTMAREVFDVTGAGDTVVATLALALADGVPLTEGAHLANIAAGIVVGKLGTATVSPDELRDAVGHLRPEADSKITTLERLLTILSRERARGKRVVFTNGCFDLLHVGHVKYLQKAKSFGDILVLGLNTDASIRRLKGPNRPLISQEERAHILSALDCVDHVVLFDEDTPVRMIEAILPDVLVKGGDYTREGVVGHEIVEAHGGRVELVAFVDGKSTTNIINRILETYR
ncbi:MAG: D-glycero-beta-D-manno-heptose-7-phosphate kinase [Desulfuromonadia bacterium]